MSSRYEGISIAMIEAMACGLPIVVSDAPGLSTYIKNEVSGLLFPIGNHVRLAECIMRLLHDNVLMKKISIGARREFDTKFDMKKNIKMLEIIYEKYAKN
jgi:glycosyltransferase involved in cell wall biosynthesis